MKVVIISGTPGTGKTTVSKEMTKVINAQVISLNDISIKKKFYTKYNSKRDTYVIDEENLIRYVLKIIKDYDPEKTDFLLIESHFSDIIPNNIIDYVIILRCNPDELLKRLKKKSYNEEKIAENVQSEILGNSVNYFINKNIKKPLLEIDTTNLNIENIVNIIKGIITEKIDFKKYYIGKIDWLEDLFQQNRLKEFFD